VLNYENNQSDFSVMLILIGSAFLNTVVYDDLNETILLKIVGLFILAIGASILTKVIKYKNNIPD